MGPRMRPDGVRAKGTMGLFPNKELGNQNDVIRKL